MARTGRPITIPGLWGPLAARVGGVQALARVLGVPERSLRNWATNNRSMDAIVASKVADLLEGESLPVYSHPGLVTYHLASAPEGWIQWPKLVGGWSARSAWKGDPTELVSGDSRAARDHGWPW